MTVIKTQDLTPKAMEVFVAQLDGKPAHEACPYYTGSAVGMAWLVGAWLQTTGRRRRAMCGCPVATRCASVTCAYRSRTLRP